MPSWIQCTRTGKLIPREDFIEHRPDKSAYIQGDIEAFKSPIDGRIIDDRGKLRRHNNEHGVTDSRDYSRDYYEGKAKKRDDAMNASTAKARAERRAVINAAIDRHS